MGCSNRDAKTLVARRTGETPGRIGLRGDSASTEVAGPFLGRQTLPLGRQNTHVVAFLASWGFKEF
jgi:hypothetical protein